MAAGCAMLGCGGEANDTANSRSPAILPGMLQSSTPNADASPPAVPFSATTPKTIAHARASWPHDTAAYTQGLLLEGQHLLESTGGEGHSDIREVARGSGRIVKRTRLPSTAFGEGIAVVADRAYQLTWKGGRGYIYDLPALARIDSFTYAGEGWGLATVGSLLFMSNGSSTIGIVDPHGFRQVKRLQVREGDKSVWMLNELELVGNELWANIYQTDFIARISPATGQIVGWIDLSELLTATERADVKRRGGVANGIAYDPSRKVVLVTGKLWPRVFELDLRDLPRVASPVH
jgi:glutaminyl-peptide cyclotransferase